MAWWMMSVVSLGSFLAVVTSQGVGSVVEMEQPECTIKNPEGRGGSSPRSDITDVHDGIVWRNCNRTNVDILLRNVSVAPYPLKLQTLLVLGNFKFDVAQSLGEPDVLVEMDLSFKMLIDGKWKELCDIVGEDECHKSDFCAELSELMRGQTCPDFIKNQGFNCSCPIPKRSYDIPFLPVGKINVPFEIAGRFMLTVIFRKEGRDIACVELKFCVERC